ncbi:serine/threonine-protein kinase [Opitutus sp. ER46]|uniref:serine/threonine-protein kinase n=1 Tax=Opitutus sp. ER46 TaxID=2161864 RepID=UPI001304DA04|nr:serine/threonine-protein kinase [Opitutus sp. ER46]
MRLENFAALDPDMSRVGLRHGGPMCEKVFKKLFNSPAALDATGELLMDQYKRRSEPTLFDPEPVKIPKAFGRYELLDPIGAGTCGKVFSCVDTHDGKAYALKIILTDKHPSERQIARFRREILLLKSQKHPGIISIFEDNLDTMQEFPGFVMELARMSLADHIQLSARPGPSQAERPLLETREAISILRSVFDAVSALHRSDPAVIHRDINPSNILLLPDGRWVIADFSLGKFIPCQEKLTTRVGGTFPYAAPEQQREGAVIDHRADIHALGVLVWELMCPGWPPYYNDTSVPKPLQPLIRRATQRAPNERYESVEELVDAFEAAIHTNGVLAIGDMQ